MKRGKLFVVMGPSGVGKTTVVKAVIKRQPIEARLTLVASYTTRSPRYGEQNGFDYYFISPAEFEEKKSAGFFLEWSCAYRGCYGTARDVIARRRTEGFSVVLVIDRHGALQVLEKEPETIIISLEPPSLEELERRLRSRNADDEASVQFRLERAEQERTDELNSPIAQFIVFNDDLETTIARVQDILVQCLIED
ncbi:MAG: guanylate kinase [Candidatus Babeliaceae bacterium]|nr:guanylate kinase [Candidatus Babeliaceae bacterium]